MISTTMVENLRLLSLLILIQDCDEHGKKLHATLSSQKDYNYVQYILMNSDMNKLYYLSLSIQPNIILFSI